MGARSDGGGGSDARKPLLDAMHTLTSEEELPRPEGSRSAPAPPPPPRDAPAAAAGPGRPAAAGAATTAAGGAAASSAGGVGSSATVSGAVVGGGTGLLPPIAAVAVGGGRVVAAAEANVKQPVTATATSAAAVVPLPAAPQPAAAVPAVPRRWVPRGPNAPTPLDAARLDAIVDVALECVGVDVVDVVVVTGSCGMAVVGVVCGAPHSRPGCSSVQAPRLLGQSTARPHAVGILISRTNPFLTHPRLSRPTSPLTARNPRSQLLDMGRSAAVVDREDPTDPAAREFV
jgi:hypothetical protein